MTWRGGTRWQRRSRCLQPFLLTSNLSKRPKAGANPHPQHGPWSAATPCPYLRAGLGTTPSNGFSPGLSGPRRKIMRKRSKPRHKGGSRSLRKSCKAVIRGTEDWNRPNTASHAHAAPRSSSEGVPRGVLRDATAGDTGPQPGRSSPAQHRLAPAPRAEKRKSLGSKTTAKKINIKKKKERKA